MSDGLVHLATIVVRGPNRPACGTYGRQALSNTPEGVTCPRCIEWIRTHM